MDTLPNADEAVIPIEKFTGYCLNLDKDPNKAIAFRLALGYTDSSAQALVDNIRTNVQNFEAVPKGNNGFGEIYECIMRLLGLNGKRANVRTSWIVLNGEDFPRLTNAYVTRKKMRGVINEIRDVSESTLENRQNWKCN